MKYPTALRTLRLAVLAATLGAGGAFAQHTTAPVMSDAAPLPADERSSAGAIVLDKAPVRAQRDRDFEQAATQASSPKAKRGILRATMRERTKTDLDQDRQDAEVNLKQHGAGSVTPK